MQRRPDAGVPSSATDPVLAATIEDWRACGDALVRTQMDALAQWRRAS